MTSLVGKRVEFQTDVCCFGQGVVIDYDEVEGWVFIEDDEGQRWFGTEDSVCVISGSELENAAPVLD